MKRKIVLILATLMCISLCACGGSESTSQKTDVGNTNSETTQNETNDTEENSGPVEGKDYAIGEDGNIAVSKNYCAENMTLIEITTDNWKEYFRVIEETLKEVDDFGEVTTTTKTVVKPYVEGKYVYGFYNPLYADDSENALKQRGAFEFKNLKTEKTSGTISLYNSIDEEVVYTLEDFELTKVSATLMLLTIPDELWNTDKYGREYVHIGKTTDRFPFTYQIGEEVDAFIVIDIVNKLK